MKSEWQQPRCLLCLAELRLNIRSPKHPRFAIASGRVPLQTRFRVDSNKNKLQEWTLEGIPKLARASARAKNNRASARLRDCFSCVVFHTPSTLLRRTTAALLAVSCRVEVKTRSQSVLASGNGVFSFCIAHLTVRLLPSWAKLKECERQCKKKQSHYRADAHLFLARADARASFGVPSSVHAWSLFLFESTRNLVCSETLPLTISKRGRFEERDPRVRCHPERSRRIRA